MLHWRWLSISKTTLLIKLLSCRWPLVDADVDTKVYHLLHSCSPALFQFLHVLWCGTSVGININASVKHLLNIITQFQPFDFAVLRNTEREVETAKVTKNGDTEICISELSDN